MPDAWAPEVVVTADLARRLLREQFPSRGFERVEPMAEGWDNTVFLVDGEWVVRFPRRGIAVDLLRVESAVLGTIGASLPLAVPVPELLGKASPEYEWPFAGYPYLPGREMAVAGLDDAQRLAAAPVLGSFIAALHAVDPTGLDLPGDTIARADVLSRREMTMTRLEVLEKDGVVTSVAAAEVLAMFDGPVRRPSSAVRVVHGDLYARHVLVDGAGIPSAVIDWGDVHLGDAAIDLLIAFSFLPPSARPAFFAAYGPVDADSLHLARVRGAFYGVAVAAYAHDIGDAVLRDESLRWIDHALEA